MQELVEYVKYRMQSLFSAEIWLLYIIACSPPTFAVIF